jgi:hypothetical protein
MASVITQHKDIKRYFNKRKTIWLRKEQELLSSDNIIFTNCHRAKHQ